MCEPENYGLYGQIALEFLTLLSSFQGFFFMWIIVSDFSPKLRARNVRLRSLMDGTEQDLCHQNKDLFKARFVLVTQSKLMQVAWIVVTRE